MHVLQLSLTLALLVTSQSSAPSADPVNSESGSDRPAAALPQVLPNDHRTPAGELSDGVLSVELRAAGGLWRPGGQDGPALTIQAFGASSGPLSSPAPLIRVHEGTQLEVTVRNDLSDPLRVSGLCDRTAACAPLDVPPGERRQLRFASGPPGTYHYWATTTGMPQQFRAANDTQLSGAFIVDPAGAAGNDRVLVITEWTSLERAQILEILKQDDPGAAFLKLRPDVGFTINGLAWPHTERLRYELGDDVRWRVINLSTQVHPMHLHGFYFDVESLGDAVRERRFGPGQRPRVVTQLMPPGSTMGMVWRPERTGNWLFHCHVMTHVSPVLHVDGTSKPHDGHGGHHSPALGMTGMVLGVTVDGPAWTGNEVSGAGAPVARKITMLMKREAGRFGDAAAFGFILGDDARNGRSSVPIPGPTLALTRGEPVEITLVNELPEATSVHWHGMELESYYDGVHGWSGAGTRVTPMIEPGASFVVRFTPPSTGTFIYHTHLHDRVQLTAGLYGALLVLEPGESLDEATDHIVVIGRGGPQPDSPVVLNNDRALQTVWKAGTAHRLRLINITPDDIVSVAMMSGATPLTWRLLTKDGAPVPPESRAAVPARQVIGVGETYDFEIDMPPGRGTVWLEVRTTGGRWHTQGRVIVR